MIMHSSAKATINLAMMLWYKHNGNVGLIFFYHYKPVIIGSASIIGSLDINFNTHPSLVTNDPLMNSACTWKLNRLLYIQQIEIFTSLYCNSYLNIHIHLFVVPRSVDKPISGKNMYWKTSRIAINCWEKAVIGVMSFLETKTLLKLSPRLLYGDNIFAIRYVQSTYTSLFDGKFNKRSSCTAIFSVNVAHKILIGHTTNYFCK